MREQTARGRRVFKIVCKKLRHLWILPYYNICLPILLLSLQFLIEPKSLEKQVKLQLPITLGTYPFKNGDGEDTNEWAETVYKPETHYPSTLPIFRPWLHEKADSKQFYEGRPTTVRAIMTTASFSDILLLENCILQNKHDKASSSREVQKSAIQQVQKYIYTNNGVFQV